MKKDISVIITLFKTPQNKLKNLKNYKNFQTLIFEQEANKDSVYKLKKSLGFNFKYFSSPKNIGLSKSSNFLLNKVSTKYCLFTQADIKISHQSILRLKKLFSYSKNLICLSPSLNLRKNQKKIEFKKKINLACVLIDVKKMKKVGFFNEDFFLYWEDIDLIRKINKSKFKMAEANNIHFKHDSSQSTKDSKQILIIRTSNFLYGELLYDFKNKKLRITKVIRKIIQNIILFLFNIIKFQYKESLKNYANFIGVMKFIFYYFKKKTKL